MRAGLGGDGDHAASRRGQQLAAIRLTIGQAGRGSAGCGVLLLRACVLLRAARLLLQELLLAQQLLVPQVCLYGLDAALRLRFLQYRLWDVGLCHLLPGRWLPRLPGMTLQRLSAMLPLPRVGRLAGLCGRAGSLLLLPRLLRTAEARHGTQRRLSLRSWMPHAGPLTSLQGAL